MWNNVAVNFEAFEGLTGCDDGFEGADKTHADHHDGEDGDRVTSHVHDQQIHRDLEKHQKLVRTSSEVKKNQQTYSFHWTEGNVPRLLVD